MAGGNFTGQNKVRPGAYINFKASKQVSTTGGVRGVVAIPLVLPWGQLDKIITVKSTDFADGTAMALIGLSATSEGDSAEYLRQVLSNAPTALVYRCNGKGAQAVVAVDNLIATAIYPGTYGNKIEIEIVKNGDLYKVNTYVSSVLKDTQIVEDISGLKTNNYVIFDSVTENDLDLNESAGIPLTGGEDGVAVASDYTNFLNRVKSYTFNTMILPTTIPTIAKAAVDVVKDMRDSKGRKSQVVIINYPEADYEGVISVNQGYKIGSVEYPVESFACYVAGLTASSAVNQSNTYHVINGATEIVDELTDEEIEKALTSGKLVLSYRQDGAVVIEQDINTLVNPGVDKNSMFAKNRVIRVLDDIANVVSEKFHMSYIGKVDNTENGRTLFKADLVNYFNSLYEMSAIQEFTADDIVVSKGESIDSVVVNVAVQPADAMEKLYMTVNVN